MLCKKCNKSVADDAKYCPYCGTKLVADPPPVPQRRNCWQCGKDNDMDAVYCSDCGEKLALNKFLARLGNEIGKKYNADHCPSCYSRNLVLYPKGYDYTKGFYLRLLNVKGGGYIAGMDRHKVCCRCMDCGRSWETDYDFRTLRNKG